MAQLTFYGATGTVTGSRFLLDTGGEKLLVDCGLFQGTKDNRLRNWEPFPHDPADIDRVLLTHAHIDHTGYLPRLSRDGFRGPVHCTHATRDLCEIMLRDSAHLQEEDARWANEKGFSKHSPALPLSTVEDAERALGLFKPLHYGQDFFPGGDVRIKLKDSGHILGSSFIDIKTTVNGRTRKILFSGDFGRPARPDLREPVQVFNVDYLVLESTYGDRLHDSRADPADELARVIVETNERGGILVIPSFAVGRTQTLLYVIRELEDAGRIPSRPVYMDSPMSIHTTDIFEKRIAELNLSSRVAALEGIKLFHPRQLHMCISRNQSKAINEIRHGAIVISSSGMATGGRILHHLMQRLPHPEHTILFIGYQAEGTRGRTILDGADTVKFHGVEVPIRANIESIAGFSGHGDYNEILAWLMGFNRPPDKTYIVHGEPEASKSLAEKIGDRYGWNVVIPGRDQTVELDM